ncbi:MAG: Rrf2 family transcriptional regulator [bacterium]
MANIFHMSEMVSLALHSIIIIAAQGEQLVNAKKVAELLGASEAHLNKALQQLVKAGYIRSVRGPKGGFTLAKNPNEINLLEIYATIEGPIDIKGCPMNCKKCIFQDCIFGGVPEEANQKFKEYMQNKTVGDCMRDIKENLFSTPCQCSSPKN